MPELPEVESTLQLLKPIVLGKTLHRLTLYRPDLRYSINLSEQWFPLQVDEMSRRAKYLVFHLSKGVMVVHLGMTGYFHWGKGNAARDKHDHVEWQLDSHWLRYHDTRRFGFIRWFESLEDCAFLKKLGPEPLSPEFNAEYLESLCRSKRAPIKAWIMDQKCVVGVGNIYASEALFSAGIHPATPSCSLSVNRLSALVEAIKEILLRAIAAGGTTIRDYQGPDSKPGYFVQELDVYGRKGMPCVLCQTPLENIKIAQRQSVFCAACQSG